VSVDGSIASEKTTARPPFVGTPVERSAGTVRTIAGREAEPDEPPEVAPPVEAVAPLAELLAPDLDPPPLQPASRTIDARATPRRGKPALVRTFSYNL
jgi:hypothetical protein